MSSWLLLGEIANIMLYEQMHLFVYNIYILFLFVRLFLTSKLSWKSMHCRICNKFFTWIVIFLIKYITYWFSVRPGDKYSWFSFTGQWSLCFIIPWPLNSASKLPRSKSNCLSFYILCFVFFVPLTDQLFFSLLTVQDLLWWTR